MLLTSEQGRCFSLLPKIQGLCCIHKLLSTHQSQKFQPILQAPLCTQISWDLLGLKALTALADWNWLLSQPFAVSLQNGATCLAATLLKNVHATKPAISSFARLVVWFGGSTKAPQGLLHGLKRREPFSLHVRQPRQPSLSLLSLSQSLLLGNLLQLRVCSQALPQRIRRSGGLNKVEILHTCGVRLNLFRAGANRRL